MLWLWGINCSDSDWFVQVPIRIPIHLSGSIDLFGSRLEFQLIDQKIIGCFKNSRDRDLLIIGEPFISRHYMGPTYHWINLLFCLSSLLVSLSFSLLSLARAKYPTLSLFKRLTPYTSVPPLWLHAKQGLKPLKTVHEVRSEATSTPLNEGLAPLLEDHTIFPR